MPQQAGINLKPSPLRSAISVRGLRVLFPTRIGGDAELIPDTPARGFVMGLIYNGGRIGGLLAPTIIGQIASGQGGLQAGLGTAVCAFVIALSIVLWVPETRGRTLR